MLNKRIKDNILIAQRNEITEHLIYSKLAQSVKEPHNRSVLKRISEDELKHYDLWRKYTHQDVKSSRLRVWQYYFIQSAPENPVLWTGMKGVSAESRKKQTRC